MQIYNHVIYPSYLIKKQRNADDLCHAFKTITPAHSDLTRLMTPVVEMWRVSGYVPEFKKDGSTHCCPFTEMAFK